MKKAHKLYLIQTAIALVLFILFAIFTETLFYSDNNIKSYLSINDGVKEMAGSTSDFLDSLIIRNDVTFDPTSGAELEKVFKNLKNSNKEKFLFVGSSQLRVIQGEKITNSYESLVSKKFEKFSNEKIQVYNLSLGGMTTPEKLIVSKKAIELLSPSNILISVTPWDCLSDKVRPVVTEINNKTFLKKKEIINNGIINKQKNSLVFPLSINENVSDCLENMVEDNMTVYSKRTGIKQWLNDKVASLFTKTDDSLSSVSGQSMADYWLTLNQELDNKSGWDTKAVKTGQRALKISNSQKISSKWEGEIVFLNTPTNIFEFEGWSKADSVSATTKLYAIDYLITFTDNTIFWYYKNLKFNKGTHDWEQVKAIVSFDKKVKSIKPHLLFYGGTGTVWFDDIKAFPIIDGVKQENIIPNSGAELELKERLNVSYSYNKEEWNKIKENMFSVVNYLKSNTAENKYLLLTPFWHTDKKSAYPQKDQYESLVNDVKKYCEQNEVKCIDASYILNKDNFGVYTNGSVKDKIDVLHFDAQAHEVLAKYIIKNL